MSSAPQFLGRKVLAILFLTLAIAAVILVIIPGLIKKLPTGLFLITADISELTDEVIAQLHVEPDVADGLSWGDYVSVGLWNACTHETDGTVTCERASLTYVFDPMSVWSADGESKGAEALLPPQLITTLDNHVVSTLWIKIFYLVGLGFAALAWLLGIVGITCATGSGSLGVVVMSFGLSATALFLAGATLATAAYASLVGALGRAFDGVITFSLGRAAVAMLWVSFVCALIAACCWVDAWRREQRSRRHLRVPMVEVVSEAEGYAGFDGTRSNRTSLYGPGGYGGGNLGGGNGSTGRHSRGLSTSSSAGGKSSAWQSEEFVEVVATEPAPGGPHSDARPLLEKETSYRSSQGRFEEQGL